jgi:hypothetical protein
LADPALVEPCWGLAMLHTQMGQANQALEACHTGLAHAADDRMAADLKDLQGFLEKYSGEPTKSPRKMRIFPE